MREPGINQLERMIVGRGYKIVKTFNGDTGICTVTLVSKDGNTKISDKNRSRASFSEAYKISLLFCWNAVRDLETARSLEK